MAFDFKKEYKDLYLPKTKPELIDVPPMSFIAVAGTATRTRKTARTPVRWACCTPSRTPSRCRRWAPGSRRLLRLHGASA